MNMVVDIGNSLIKAAVFEHQELVWQIQAKPDIFLKKLKIKLQRQPNIENLIYSASGKPEKKILNFFHKHFKVSVLDHKITLPFKSEYETPQTLGLDRIALLAAADKLYTGQNVFIIDAGTCITYDLITKDRIYIGGNISPGLDMRFKALNHFTANLPLITQEDSLSFPLGKSTKDAILNGVTQGVVDEIDQNIKRYTSDYKDLTVILTGGDQQYLSAQLKNSIFANSTFQLVGLNAILEYLLND